MRKYLLLGAVIVSASVQADFDKGLACYTAKDYACAYKEFKSGAEKGDAKSQYQLGEMFFRGDGIQGSDNTEAVKWYRLAADQGYAEAQSELSFMYYGGFGVKQDYTESVKCKPLTNPPAQIVNNIQEGVTGFR